MGKFEDELNRMRAPASDSLGLLEQIHFLLRASHPWDNMDIYTANYSEHVAKHLVGRIDGFVANAVAGALALQEVNAWHVADHADPPDREIVYIVISSYSRHFQSIGYLDYVSGTWLIYQDLGGGFAPLADHASVIRWREKPKYPALEGN
jgi:hypothetical protein